MKALLTIWVIYFPLMIFSQTSKISGKVLFAENNLPVSGLLFEFTKDKKVIYNGTTDINGNYNFEDIPIGTYDLKMSFLGYKDLRFSNFSITEKPKSISFTFPEPCIESKKECPKNHKDKIVPIVYGLPGEKMLKKAKSGKIKLRGCVVSDCDPKWFCKDHNLEF